ncbi:MAG: hypothetical protein ACOY9J_02185 [Pseudomonadota bacterium]
MKKPSQVKDWFTGEDPAQVNWAMRYWTNKARPDLAAQMYGAPALRALEALAGKPEGYELLTKMRRAWNTHKSKANRQRKTYSFVISATADRQLRNLTKGRSKSATLEELISRGFDFEKELRIERRKEIQQTKKDLEKRVQIHPRPSIREMQAKGKANALLAELKEQAEVLEAALHENCQLRVQLEDAKINPDQLLNADQQLRAGHAYRIRIEYLNRDLAGRRRLAKYEAQVKSDGPT